MKKIKIYTIGFTQKTAQFFFETLQDSGVTQVVDTRLNNVSQLAGFAKRKDLAWFLNTINGIPYQHNLNLAPTKDILDDYKKKRVDWDVYEQNFLDLISKRKIEESVSPESLHGCCLLCSEATPHHCHRRLVAEYLNSKWGNVEICHL